ncbi:Rne/Rng family ribonuclease [Paeniglutamicibacter sp. ABSL32-1]|uniref:Rne/Rng family ribonuclease n=1 Tax=Paeniglutamicibacter quisquiliarum TaxID=2849498 RepID=UPI001C2D3E50|nr:Rne/Rng family ribonuclease [Paeniglutamicibacter quisquiliarum]MBV1778319.1 Rne/Rng family ribonuclease [Paeniglutamicibacter quisquiliarum]
MALNRDESKAAMGQGPKGRSRTSRPPRGNFNEPSPPPPRRAMTLAELNDAAAAPTRKVRANVSPRAATARRAPATRNAPAREATVESVVAEATGKAPAAKVQAPAAEAVTAPAKAPARRGPRRATSGVTSPGAAAVEAPAVIEAPAALAAAEAQTEIVAEKSAAPAAEAAEPKTAAKRPARGRGRKATAPASNTEAPAAEEAPEVPAAEAAVEATEEQAEGTEPAKATRRRPARGGRGTRAAQEAAAETPAAESAEPEAAAADATTEPDPATISDPFAIPESALSLIFQAPSLPAAGTPADEDEHQEAAGSGRRGRSDAAGEDADDENADGSGAVSRRRRRRRRGEADLELAGGSENDPPNTITRVRAPRTTLEPVVSNKVTAVRGSTRLEAKRQRRRDSRESGRRRQVITEAEFLARRESVDRQMIVRQREDRIQIGVLEDGILAEHFVSKTQQDSLIGNVYVGKVQNVLPSMEAAFVDIGRGRNAVLYAGEVNWDVAGLDGQPRRIEHALKSGDTVLVQVTKDPVGHKGARLTSQISLPGRYLVYVPGGSMTGISRKLPDVERNRLKKILKDHLPENAGVIVRTAAEGASEEELMNDINRLRAQWEGIEAASTSTKTLAPELLYGEPDLTIKVVRDVFNEDFTKLIVSGDEAWDTIEAYVTYVAPDLVSRLEKWESDEDIFGHYRLDEQIHKALDRKVFLPSGGSLVIDRTEAMTVVDVNTGKYTGSGGNLEETVTKNNLEAAEEVVRQLRLRDIGGIIVIDFIDMVLESNRDLVLRRLVECLGRDRTKHQVAEVTSLGLVQMTRKRMGTGLLEVFGENCEACNGRGVITHDVPVEHRRSFNSAGEAHGPSSRAAEKPSRAERRRRNRSTDGEAGTEGGAEGGAEETTEAPAAVSAPNEAKATATRNAFATIAAAAHAAHEHDDAEAADGGATLTVAGESVVVPAARRNRRAASSEASAPSLTLENLEAALPDNSPVADAPAEAEEGESAQSRPARSRTRRKARAKAPEASAAPAAEQPAAASAPVISGVAGQASDDAPSEAPAATSTKKTSGIEPVARAKRSRRATSPQGGSDTAVSVASDTLAASGTSHVASLADPTKAPQPPIAANAPIMLGVGVPVKELKE